MRLKHRCFASAVLVAATITCLAAAPASARTGQYDGVNWADPRDNFADTELVLSGLARGDSYNRTRAKAKRFAEEFFDKLGANTVRIPINPATVNTASWQDYRGVIDGIRASGSNVIVAYWEGTNKDGRIDDQAAFNRMWDRVVRAYGADGGVLFEPMNEPHGYEAGAWRDVAAKWLDRHRNVPRKRVIIDGEKYSELTAPICTDPRLQGTRVSLHNYAFWRTLNYDEWLENWRAQVTPCPNRIIITEFGTTVNGGQNFNAPSADNGVVYMQAAARIAREYGLGAVYWPGLRDGDSYSMTTRSGSGAKQTLNVVNSTARDALRYAWGM